MARNKQAAAHTPKDQPDTNEPATIETAREIPEVGLGDLMGDGDNDPDMQLDRVNLDTAERHTESAPPALPRGPAAAHELRAERITYPAKPAANCGPTVQSLTKAELGNRTALDKVLCVCPEHHTPCYSGVREGIFTRMYCPVMGCNFSHKMVVPTTAELINRAARREERQPLQHDIAPR